MEVPAPPGENEVPTAGFFYGTLMETPILDAMIKSPLSSLTACTALLPEFTRHGIVGSVPPALLPFHEARAAGMVTDKLAASDRCVRGVLVQGLTEADWEHLDWYEGRLYTRAIVHVYRLSELGPISSPHVADLTTALAMPDLSTLDPAIAVYAYVWVAPLTFLTRDIWSFEEFVR
ncbi:hypothetical protein CALCODRAFT_455073, partial [Calocera cornea HHB12733]